MKKLIAANWKMNPVPDGALHAPSIYQPRKDVDVVVLPSFLDMEACAKVGLVIGGQYGRPEDAGAFTGDISMAMLKAHGAAYVLCGHSERRHHHEESPELIGKQLQSALRSGLTPILCIGETWDDYDLNLTQNVLKQQLSGYAIDARTIIAYEPVWAIGTGKTPTTDEIRDTHAFLRGLVGQGVRLLYGGSVSAGNAPAILSLPNVDGALVGGASLKSEFVDILSAAVVH